MFDHCRLPYCNLKLLLLHNVSFGDMHVIVTPLCVPFPHYAHHCHTIICTVVPSLHFHYPIIMCTISPPVCVSLSTYYMNHFSALCYSYQYVITVPPLCVPLPIDCEYQCLTILCHCPTILCTTSPTLSYHYPIIIRTIFTPLYALLPHHYVFTAPSLCVPLLHYYMYHCPTIVRVIAQLLYEPFPNHYVHHCPHHYVIPTIICTISQTLCV